MQTVPAVAFETLPLLRVFYTLDMAEGALYRHEVRRDPISGLTLTRKQEESSLP
jgi:hypothetical protein